MSYVNLVHDGSEDKLVMGYWGIEVYAYLKDKRILPLALDVYGIDDPAVGSENLQIARVVTANSRARSETPMGSLELASRSNKRSDRSTVSVAGLSSATFSFLADFCSEMIFAMCFI